MAVYDKTNSSFYILPSGSGAAINIQYGTPGHGDIPLEGDHDGTGKTNIGVYDSKVATFAYIRRPEDPRPGEPHLHPVPDADPHPRLQDLAPDQPARPRRPVGRLGRGARPRHGAAGPLGDRPARSDSLVAESLAPGPPADRRPPAARLRPGGLRGGGAPDTLRGMRYTNLSAARFVLILPLLIATGLTARAGEEPPPPAAGPLPAIPLLPDPFLRPDGSRVKDRGEWAAQREGLGRLVQQYGYGTLPPETEKVEAEAISPARATPGEARVLLKAGPGGKVRTTVVLTVPEGKGPFPAIIAGDLCWGRVKPEIVAEVLKRGYLLAEFDRTEFAPDRNERTGPLHAAYPDGDFGALAAWAWGYHRVVDYLLTRPDVDGKKVAITGHSRGGKATLLAGATDERIALTAPNNSGCMGAGCERFAFEGESLPRIVKVFPYWFGPRLGEFTGRVDRLPFDQHTLKALVAPRALLTTEGLGDLWANPRGTQITFQAARVVYDFLGAPDKIGLVFRPGGHEHGLKDWQALLDFADSRLLGRDVPRRFDELAFPDDARERFTWTAPEGS